MSKTTRHNVRITFATTIRSDEELRADQVEELVWDWLEDNVIDTRFSGVLGDLDMDCVDVHVAG